MPFAYLPSRSLVRISGKDAQDFLQNLITTDVDGLPEREARPGALLTPQGKILFDFLIWRNEDGFTIETELAQREALVRRLTMYKLRAAVELATGADGVTVFWGEDAERGRVRDSAFAGAGIALSRAAGQQDAGLDQQIDGAEAAYHALRIRAGLPVSGEDFALQDAFPHDLLFDKSGGVSFRKGCYVGQEVVSRMQHRGTARRRTVLVAAETPLPSPGTEIMAGDKPVGTLGSVQGTQGLAIVRIDRVGDALSRSLPLLAAGVSVVLTLPAWSGLTFPTEGQEAET
ncbi:folate-binding protein [Neorhizobium lilium]|uniref:Folate-binding protein n=1 Tax=Neorhizobium lilium TaxID=2503024 RepID=A0A3S3S410_9HYPH|nr:folate-binding protein YgfZ [Neorhizobium lilium]RWX76141.1 folate-binding protein [Neorhizobium lilium]